MIRSLYAAVSGLRNHQIRMDVIANNVANVNTTGFKSSRANFQDVLSQTLRAAGDAGEGFGATNPAQVGLGMSLAGISMNFAQGALQNTGRTLDVAIQGNGFFVIKKLAEEEMHYVTREGVFFIDNEGYLVNSNGYFVCKEDGDVIQVASDPATIESIAITDTGKIIVNGSEVATIGLAFFPNPEGLEKVGQNLYRATPASGGYDPDAGVSSANINIAGTADTPLANTRLASGYLEMSNVDLSEEFTNMITTQRGYQANARVITVSDTLLEELVNLKR